MTEETKPVKIKGTVYWASLKKVNQMSGNYQVDIGELSEAAVKALEAMGVTALHKDTQGFYLSLIHISEPTRRHHVSRMPSSA